MNWFYIAYVSYNLWANEYHQNFGFDINTNREEKPNERFKMPYFFAFIGYTLVLFIEKVVFKISEHDHGHGHSHDHRVHDEDKEHSIKEHVETNQRLEQREGLNR